MIDLIRSWREHIIPGHALDIGAGDGELSLWLAKRGFAVDALEPQPELAEGLRRSMPASVRPLQMDILDFSLIEGHYTLIVASAVLHFIEDGALPQLAGRLMNALAPGGMLFAAAFTTDDPARSEAHGATETPVLHFFEPGELGRLFQPLDILFYEESRRAAPHSSYGYRSGATLVARRPR